MERRIIYVGEALIQSEDLAILKYGANESLLDGDIVIFSVDVSSYSRSGFYQDRPWLDDDSSFRLKRNSEHWRSELRAALEDGKTVIVFVNDSPEVSVATGERQYSGTGRNRQTTRIVATFDPYEAIPAPFGKVVRRSGERIKTLNDPEILATYWHEFGKHSPYEAYIEGFKGTPLLVTQTGNKAVGGIIRSQLWKGTLVFLPPPNLESAVQSRIESLKEKSRKRAQRNSSLTERQNGNYLRKAHQSVVLQFTAALVGIDKAARSVTDMTPPPAWSSDDRFRLAAEADLLSQIDEKNAQIEILERERDALGENLDHVRLLRSLLYEKGKPLEKSILVALRLLGFDAENLQEEDSEFDAVMVDADGSRLIGEAEGKDDKAINVDKLDQLDRNLKEDFARQPDEGAQFAIGVLFGNSFRLTAPDQRLDFFTKKCLLAAQRSQICLVKTTDLFTAAQYVERSKDERFAALCRVAIKDARGEIVIFPNVPN